MKRVLSVLLLWGASAYGQTTTQGFLLDRFDPAERGSGWFVNDDLSFGGDLTLVTGVVGDLGVRPLVVHDDAGNIAAILVSEQLFTHVGASLTLQNRFRFGLSLPIALSQGGDGGTVDGQMYASPGSAAVGDLRLSADVRIVSENALSLAAGVQVFLPTGSRDQYTGDGSVRIAPHVLVGGHAGVFTWAGKLAFEYRGIDGVYDGFSLGSDLVFSAAAGAALLHGKLLVGPELYGSTSVTSSDSFFSTRGTPVEVLLGAHYRLTKDLSAGAGVGTGLTHGLGSPTVRAVLGIEWSPPLHTVTSPMRTLDDEPPTPTAPDAPDHVALPTAKDEPADRDGDGIPDSEDACPDDLGVPTTDPRTNGCPPATLSGGDRDGDGISDEQDACPDEWGFKSPNARWNGCPHRAAVLTRTEIVTERSIAFDPGADAILAKSEPTLTGIVQELTNHPEVAMLRIEVHAEATANKGHDQRLSERRAHAIGMWLVKHGVKSNRLTPVGMGGDKSARVELKLSAP
jgi:outer membrane protein OmpA-like peptidoglycan-associated protein